MNPTDYILDSALVLIVLLQIRERTLTNRSLIRPLVIVGIAVASYLNGFPTAGNDLILVTSTVLLGTAIGTASELTMFMRRGVGVLLGAWHGLALCLHLLEHAHGRLIDRALQRHELDHQR